MTPIVLDIETVACVSPPILQALVADAQREVKKEKPKANKPKVETLERIEREYIQKLAIAGAKVVDKLPLSPMTGRVLCIGLGVRLASGWEFDVWLAKTAAEEVEVLTKAATHIELETDPRLITYNGRRFDMPYLVARSMKNHVGGGWPLGYQRHRHVDLYDALGSGTMNDWSQLILNDMKDGAGSDVEKWFKAEDWPRIERYNLHDIKLLAGLYDRFEAAASWA